MQVQTNVVQNPGVAAPLVLAASDIPVVVNLHRVNLQSFLQEQSGRFVSVTFTKANGEERVLTGRLGVKSYLAGGLNMVMAPDRPYLTVFDVKILGYRTVNLSAVSQLRAAGKVFEIID